MSSSDDKSTSCGDDDGGIIQSNKKVSTSCDQKVESCNNDGVDHNTSSNIDALSDNLGRVDISKDDDDDDDDDDKMSISDEKLFQDPPPREECPICFLPMPVASGLCGVKTTYHPCCGKTICEGCVLAEDEEMKKGNIKQWCALCRMPIPSFLHSEEQLKRMRKRMDFNDAEAFYSLGCSYRDGDCGLPQDFAKSMELWQKAAELGHPEAHHSLGRVYFYGQDVEKDMKKAIHHYKLAAMGGDEYARYALGLIEEAKGNINHAMKHFMIAARSGEDDSLKMVGEGYKAGYVTKDEYANALRAYQCSCDEMKSDERAKALYKDES